MALRPLTTSLCIGLLGTALCAQGWRQVEYENEDGTGVQARLYRSEAEGPTLICVDLFNTPLNSFQPLWAYARKAGMNLAVVDVRGMGLSATATSEENAESHATPYASMHKNILATVDLLARRGHDTSRLGLLCTVFGAGPGMVALEERGSPFRAAMMVSPMPTIPQGRHGLKVQNQLDQYAGPPLMILENESSDLAMLTAQWSKKLEGNPRGMTKLLAEGERTMGTQMFGVVPGVEQTIIDYFSTYLGDEAALSVPVFSEEDAGGAGFFRSILNVGRNLEGEVHCSLNAFAVGDTLTLGPMVKGGKFKGEVSIRVGDRELVFPFDTEAEGRTATVQVNGGESAGNLEGRRAGTSDGTRWTHVEVPLADWMPADGTKVTVEFRAEGGKAIQIPAAGTSFVARPLTR